MNSVGFCCGGFSSTAGYVSGNEARLLREAAMSDWAAFRLYLPEKASFVFIQTT